MMDLLSIILGKMFCMWHERELDYEKEERVFVDSEDRI